MVQKQTLKIKKHKLVCTFKKLHVHDQSKNIQKEIKRNQHILYEDGQIHVYNQTLVLKV